MIKLLYFCLLSTKSGAGMGTGLGMVNTVRNIQFPVCKNCVHFIEHTNNYPYDPVPDNEQYGKCKKFGEMDVVSGAVHHDYARLCRENTKKCGIRGSEYEAKTK